MMMPVSSISANPTEFCPAPASPPLGEQAQFECALAQAAADSKNDTVLGPARVVPVTAPLDVERTTAQTSPWGDRLFQMISPICRDNSVASSAPDKQLSHEKNALPGPAQKLPVDGAAAGTPIGHDFGAMIAGLRDLYFGVTQISIISKGVSGVTSSVNTLIKQG
ncbi:MULTISPECIES: nodulation protein NolB [Microvirga]|uniref:nodulation protein NolB n=1 Tax=Microvirga TaxID=186650 RepID=UPI000E0DC0AF|nr:MULTISPECIES: nodulation protein NolB [Microvirga]MBQ0820144.1 nodulation protein NolB [Microvirga sp. HBU67558]